MSPRSQSKVRAPLRHLVLGAATLACFYSMTHGIVLAFCGQLAPSLTVVSPLVRKAEGSSDSQASDAAVKQESSPASEDAPKEDAQGGGETKETFNALLAAADKFAAKKKKRELKRQKDSMEVIEHQSVSKDIVDYSNPYKKKPEDISLARAIEDEAKGLTLQDDSAFESSIDAAYRKGTLEISFVGRWKQWFEETWMLITNPSEQQVSYVAMWTATVLGITLFGAFWWSTGNIHFKRDTDPQDFIDKYRNNPKIHQIAYAKQVEKLYEGLTEGDDVRDLAPPKIVITDFDINSGLGFKYPKPENPRPLDFDRFPGVYEPKPETPLPRAPIEWFTFKGEGNAPIAKSE